MEIARDLGVELYEHPWQDSFSEARNHSLDYAKGKWIFWMDADDTLPAHTGESILRAALAAPPEIAGLRRTGAVRRGGPGSRHARRSRQALPQHPRSAGSKDASTSRSSGPSRKHGEIARIDAVVLHSGYDTTDEGQKNKRERDFKLLSLDLKERPNHPFVLFNLGMTCHYTRKHKKAVDWLRKSIEHSQEGESHLRKAYALMAVSQRELGRKEEALATLKAGLKAVGEDPELHFQLGLLLSDMGRLDGGPDALHGGAGKHGGALLQRRRRHHGLQALPQHGGRLRAAGLYKEAKEWWLRAMREAPAFTPSAFALFDEALAREDLACARTVPRPRARGRGAEVQLDRDGSEVR